MNTNIEYKKVGLGLECVNKEYFLIYDIESDNPILVKKELKTEKQLKTEIFKFKTIRDAALFLKDDNFLGFQFADYEDCPQMLVNAFNNVGNVLVK